MVGFCLRFAFCPCHASHIMSSCASHFAYVFVSCIRAFSPLSVLQSGTPMFSGASFCLFSCAGVKLSRNRPRFAKRPWYTTSRPPVKFCIIWRPFDAPTVNLVPQDPFCVAAAGGGRFFFQRGTDTSGGGGGRNLGFHPEFWRGCTYLYIEGGGSVQMESGFRPRDRDRMLERMEGFCMGYWAVLEGCLAAT